MAAGYRHQRWRRYVCPEHHPSAARDSQVNLIAGRCERSHRSHAVSLSLSLIPLLPATLHAPPPPPVVADGALTTAMSGARRPQTMIGDGAAEWGVGAPQRVRRLRGIKT